MPEEMVFRPGSEIMQDDEILTLVTLFAELGFEKIRLTGGEPTIRHNVVELVRQIAGTPGIQKLSMTTNGVLLERLADPLRRAGLQRVNISIDTLDPERFRRITRWGEVEDVWNGIYAAEKAGLTPIKINSVIVQGYNESDALSLACLTLEHSWQVRFIEMMPFAGQTDLQLNHLVTAQDIKQTIETHVGPLISSNGGHLDGEARLYKIPGGAGEIGFISSVSEPFCASCTRARLTADGRLRLCLLREGEVDLLTPLRAGASHKDLHQLISGGICNKPWGHGLDEGLIPLNRAMSEIGG
jgi:cyclic pyranopterin phosphate synthase